MSLRVWRRHPQVNTRRGLRGQIRETLEFPQFCRGSSADGGAGDRPRGSVSQFERRQVLIVGHEHTAVQALHAALLRSRAWGLAHLDELADAAAAATGIARAVCRAYLGDLDYALSYRHLAGLTDFFRRLAQDGIVPDGSLSFITAA